MTTRKTASFAEFEAELNAMVCDSNWLTVREASERADCTRDKVVYWLKWLQKRGLADAALAGNQAQLSALNQVFQPPQSFVHALVLPQGSHRGVF